MEKVYKVVDGLSLKMIKFRLFLIVGFNKCTYGIFQGNTSVRKSNDYLIQP